MLKGAIIFLVLGLILGAMGLREVRRLRGEMGRAMFMETLEADAFAGLLGYTEAK